MEETSTYSNVLCNCNLIVLSYHVFGEEESDYPFSRTYKQFAVDIVQRDYDWITIDDGHKSIIKACAMMQEKNIRAKLFISTALVGLPNYCTWDDLWKLSRFHDIENHSHRHENLTKMPVDDAWWNIGKAGYDIKTNVGRKPRYFVPPWNQYNEDIENIVDAKKMQLIKNRITIKNDS